jgi:hypothetical protein
MQLMHLALLALNLQLETHEMNVHNLPSTGTRAQFELTDICPWIFWNSSGDTMPLVFSSSLV